MAVAGDGPGWGRNNNTVRASATGDHTGREAPRSAAADYGRATVPPQQPPMPSWNAEPPRPASAASRYGAAPRAADPRAVDPRAVDPRAFAPYAADPYRAPQGHAPAYPQPTQYPHQPAGYPPQAAGYPSQQPYGYPPQAAPAYPDPAYADPYQGRAADPYAPQYGADPYAGYAQPEPEPEAEPVPAAPPTRVALLAGSVSRWTRYAGAAASVALVLGLSWWSYQLLMRDVKGVPVVKAMEGPMRISPENPGGEVSADTGLAVNAIAALGTAAPPEDELALAPVATRLTEEDLSVAVQPLPEGAEPAPTLIVNDADFSAFNAAPAPTAPAEQPVDPEQTTEEPPEPEPEVAPEVPAVPGIPDAPERPRARPTALNTAPVVADTTSTASVSGPLPSGTPLVQFGAYDSLALAAGEWDRLMGRFSGLMSGKNRVIQEASSGGRTFFRLRATGFGDLADARRFCSAVVAEGAECIPTIEP